MRLDPKRWLNLERHSGGLYELPTMPSRDSERVSSKATTNRHLDVGGLRGRYMAEGEVGPLGEAGARRFGRSSHEFVDVIYAQTTE